MEQDPIHINKGIPLATNCKINLNLIVEHTQNIFDASYFK